MKNVIIFSLLLVITGLSCQKDVDPVPDPDPADTTTCCKTDLTKGLLAYYPFNGNFNDESGNGNTAFPKNGAVLTTDLVGRVNRAAGFDGIDDYLIVPGNSKLNSDTFTVSFQVMANTVNRNFGVVSRTNFETVQSTTFALHHSLAADSFWTFSVTPGTDDCSKLYPRDNSLYAFSKGPIQAKRWYNVIFSFAGGVQKIYVDGVLEATSTKTFTTSKKCNNADLVIGGWWKNDIMSLNGKIDEVRLYNRVLTECEIAELSETFKGDGDPTPECTANLTQGLLAYYPFNGNFNDESGNGNNATAKNGAALTTDYTGSANKAAGFDGVDDYLIVPASNKLDADTISVSFQVMVNNVNRRNAMITRINFETATSYAFAIQQSSAADKKWGFGVAPGTDDCSKGYGSDTTHAVYPKDLTEPGRWYNVLVSFANGVQKVYVDGVLQESKTRTFSNVKKCSLANLVIGAWWKSDLLPLDGKIDEVRLYNRLLTDCEIAKLAEPFRQK